MNIWERFRDFREVAASRLRFFLGLLLYLPKEASQMPAEVMAFTRRHRCLAVSIELTGTFRSDKIRSEESSKSGRI